MPANGNRPFLLVSAALASLALSLVQPMPAQQYGTLTDATLNGIPDQAVRLDLYLFRADPELLQERFYLRYFIALNNCNNAAVDKALDNELDYPALASYYQAHAAQILGALPDTIELSLFAGSGRMLARMFEEQLKLGEYDPSTSSFPIILDTKRDNQSSANGQTTVSLGSLFKRHQEPAQQNHAVNLTGNIGVGLNRARSLASCPVADRVLRSWSGPQVMLPTYTVLYDRTGFDTLPMDINAARTYIDSHPALQRTVALSIDFHVQNKADIKAPGFGMKGISSATFTGKIARVTVIDSTLLPLGFLADDHSLPLPVVPTAPTSPAEKLAAIRDAVFVYERETVCQWDMGGGQFNALQSMETRIHSTGTPQEKQEWDSAVAREYALIGAKRAYGYCALPGARAQYDSILTRVWPNGPIAHP